MSDVWLNKFFATSSGEKHRLIPVQYTGIKDNTPWEKLTEKEQKAWLKDHIKEEWNGREIYEGDIITRIGHYRDKSKKKRLWVDWDEYSCVWGGFFGKSARHVLNNFMKNELEVIGSVHENSELLR